MMRTLFECLVGVGVVAWVFDAFTAGCSGSVWLPSLQAVNASVPNRHNVTIFIPMSNAQIISIPRYGLGLRIGTLMAKKVEPTSITLTLLSDLT